MLGRTNKTDEEDGDENESQKEDKKRDTRKDTKDGKDEEVKEEGKKEDTAGVMQDKDHLNRLIGPVTVNLKEGYCLFILIVIG